METSFLELRCKNVINVTDGRSLGHIIDIIIDIRTSRVLGLVVPGHKGFFSLFKNTDDIFIPYCNICKIAVSVLYVYRRCARSCKPFYSQSNAAKG